jgi:hypothetical protein
MTSSPPRVVDQVPPTWRFRAYQGDPFDIQIALTLDGAPADVTDWTWAAQISTGPDLIDFECSGEPDGVHLYLRGPDTLRLPQRYCPFDVVGRNPAAGEGRTVLRGLILAAVRVTPPLRAALT